MRKIWSFSIGVVEKHSLKAKRASVRRFVFPVVFVTFSSLFCCSQVDTVTLVVCFVRKKGAEIMQTAIHYEHYKGVCANNPCIWHGILHIRQAVLVIVSMVLCAMAGVNAVAQQSGQQAAQEFLWDGRGRAPLGTVPVRYVPISAQQHPFQTWHNFPWSSSATVRVSTSAILSITPNASTGSSRGQRTRVEFMLSSEAVFRRVIGVFFGNKMARAFNVQEAELGKPRVIAALVDSMAANTGYSNGFRTTAGVILEREKDTLITNGAS